MNEADLVDQWTRTAEILWTLFQFWGGVSFGLIAIAYLAANKLNRTLLVSVISLYCLFSAWLGYGIGNLESLRNRIALDLQELAISNGSTSNLAEGIVEIMLNPPTVYTLLPALAIAGTFFGCIGYLEYAYVHKGNT
ncbi:MAG TPA: hypothetical protein DCM64_07130 [Gammaproteobacteria bacterium]|jgi:hypothetical protein|nr:hypothetical protein [Gammaproteobacteria bacterium]MDP6731226.1 hypothetical protein [Gammaproteobacteria bacterium]HAJ76213.1 hypothetical protein [Gammaproteobacteria bacterium]|tara:strand:+ start:2154 stop:2564 length:411 start_codon:yes stop_codon:yes gene_type:complete